MTQSRNLIRKRWKPDAVALQLVTEHFATSRTDDLAAVLCVTSQQVRSLAHRLGLRKSQEWLNGPEGGRTDGARGQGTRFRPGQVPWSKGRKLGSEWNKRTQFKPGQKPANYAPVGSFRVMSAGYLQIKLTDTGYPPKDWVMFHRHVWTQAHGPVPAGHLVVFKDRRRRITPAEVTLDVLECVSRQEHLSRHTVHQLGPELAGIVLLRGALTRQIKRRQQQDEEAHP